MIMVEKVNNFILIVYIGGLILYSLGYTTFLNILPTGVAWQNILYSLGYTTF